MAIDSRRKRASVAVLGLAFLGPSIVPDGSFVQADRQAIAHSYYGIAAGGAFVEIGGTSQLEPFTSTGGITLEQVIGGTSQLEAFASTGGITLERVLGDTSQLEAFASSGVIQVGDVVEVVNPPGGGGGARRAGRTYPYPTSTSTDKPKAFKAESEEKDFKAELKLLADIEEDSKPPPIPERDDPLETPLGEFSEGIVPDEEGPKTKLGGTLQNLVNFPERSPELTPEGLRALIAGVVSQEVEAQVAQALESARNEDAALKIMAALEAEMVEGQPLDPRVEELLLLLLLV